MCGIFLAIGPQDRIKETEPRLLKSVAAVEHRGPDSTGVWKKPGVFLGHTRLSVIDVDTRSDQPFELGDFVMVYNGEIFNYVELAEELRMEGVEFDLRSDTEVVLRAFIQWGNDCFQKFNGMWALAILDKRDNSIIFSRDRFGQKPMFYAQDGDLFYLSSEVHQLSNVMDVTPNEKVIVNFLEEGDSVLQPDTFFNEIFEFPAACYASISPEGAMIFNRYWDYPDSSKVTNLDIDFESFEKLLDDSVRIRTRSDVPLGILLSGGVDSTIIASSLVESYEGPAKDIKAICFKSEGVRDESGYAAKVASDLDLSFHTTNYSGNPKHFIATLHQLLLNMGRGHSSPAIIPVDQLYKIAHDEGLKVVLDGQGADELLAGYKIFYIDLMLLLLRAGKFNQLKETFLAMLSQNKNFKGGVLEILILHFRTVSPAWVRRIMRSIYGYGRFFSGVTVNAKARVNSVIDSSEQLPKFNANKLNQLLVKQHSKGLRNLLFYGDITAMNHSIENRSPFMDHRLVDFAFSRDEALKVYDGIEKYTLRMNRHYKKFERVLDRNKVGFDSPIHSELRNVMREEIIKSTLIDSYLFRPQLRAFLKSPAAVSDKYERFLFRLYQVNAWYAIFDMKIPQRKTL